MWACPVGSGKLNPTAGYGTVHVVPNCFWLLPACSCWVAVRTSFAMDTPTRWYRPYSCYFLYTLNKRNNTTTMLITLVFYLFQIEPKIFERRVSLLNGTSAQSNVSTYIPFVCRDVGSDEPEYCKTCPLALPSRRTVKLNLSFADSISRLASLSVMPSTTEWLLIFNSTSPSCTLLSPPFVPSLMKILLPKTIPKSKRDKIFFTLRVYILHII